MTRTLTTLRPRARMRRWLMSSHQPVMSIRLSVAALALLALLAIGTR